MATRVLVIGESPLRAAIRFDAQRPGVVDVFNPHTGSTKEAPLSVVSAMPDMDIREAVNLSVENQQRWVEFTARKTYPRNRRYGVQQ